MSTLTLRANHQSAEHSGKGETTESADGSIQIAKAKLLRTSKRMVWSLDLERMHFMVNI